MAKTTVGTHEELLAAVPAYRQLFTKARQGGQQHEMNNKSGVFAALAWRLRAHYPLTIGTLLCDGGVSYHLAAAAAAAGTHH